MERRSSGLKKITDRTNALFTNNENHVKFFADNMFFTVIIYNANYGSEMVGDITDEENVVENVVDDVVDNVVDNVVDELHETERQVLDVLRTDDTLAAKHIAAQIDKAPRTVQRALTVLKDKGYIERVGTDRNGKWKILK